MTTTYTYDSNGLRTSKTTGDDVTEYTYLGSSLVYQVTNKGQSDEVSLYFYYDDTGLAAFYYESAQYPSDNGIYHYVKDAQGNIWGIIDNKGTQIVKYEFSAYGEYRSRWSPEEVSLEEIRRNNRIRNANPFDYRGYYYDKETGLYYCQSRYYDPEVDRWINPDSKISGIGGDIRGYNVFAYCFNDPVNMIDSTGNWPSWGQIFAAVATVAVAAVVVTAMVMSAGAVGIAAGIAAASAGATGTLVSTAITVATVGTYAVAAGIGACAVSNAGEILTGTNVIRDGLMGGNQKAYDTVQAGLSIVGGSAIIAGQTNPGVTGNAAKPSQNAQTVHTVPNTGAPKSTFDKLYPGKINEFQRTYYDYKGNMSLQIDFTTHNNPLIHSNPHVHTYIFGRRQHQINLWYLE